MKLRDWVIYTYPYVGSVVSRVSGNQKHGLALVLCVRDREREREWGASESMYKDHCLVYIQYRCTYNFQGAVFCELVSTCESNAPQKAYGTTKTYANLPNFAFRTFGPLSVIIQTMS